MPKAKREKLSSQGGTRRNPTTLGESDCFHTYGERRKTAARGRFSPWQTLIGRRTQPAISDYGIKMAGPSNADNRDGTESSTGTGTAGVGIGRGRGVAGRTRGSFPHGRRPGALRGRVLGRGPLPTMRAGRGRGGPTRAASSAAAASAVSASGNVTVSGNVPGKANKAPPPAGSPVSSPFAVLKDKKQDSRPASSISGKAAGPQQGKKTAFGKPSTLNAPSPPPARVVKSPVPVEDASTLNKYNERYEQVSGRQNPLGSRQKSLTAPAAQES